MRLPFTKPKEPAPPPEPEPVEEPRQNAPRVTFPTAQIEASVKEGLDDLRKDIADYSYKTRDGDFEAGDRVETIIVSMAFGVAGLISDKRPDIAAYLVDAIQDISDEYNGAEFLKWASYVVNRAIGMTMFVGRTVPSTSVDKGEGLEEIIAMGERE